MSVEEDKETRKMGTLSRVALQAPWVESAVTKQQGIMGNSGECTVDNRAKKEKPAMSVELLMSREKFGFHLGLNTGCILTRFKTCESL
jgi:hypothetical protein